MTLNKFFKNIRVVLPIFLAIFLTLILILTSAPLLSAPAFAAGLERSYVVGANRRFGAVATPTGYKGAGCEYIDKLSAVSFNRFSYTSDTPEALFKKLIDGTVDLIPCVTQSELEKYENYVRGGNGRESILTIVPSPLFSKFCTISVSSIGSKSNMEFGNEYEINKLTIGYLIEDEQDFFVEGNFAVKALRGANFVSYQIEDDLKLDLRRGAIDAVAKNCFMHWDNETIIYTFNLEPCYFAVRRQNTELAAEMIKGINDIMAHFPSFSSNIYEKYISDYGSITYAFTKEESDYIANNKRFTIAYNLTADFAGYWNANTSTIGGVPARIFNEFAKATGFTIEVVAYDNLSVCIEQLRSGKVNAVFGGVSPEGIADYTGCFVSSPVTSSPLVLLTRADNDSDVIRSVAMAGSNSDIKNAIATFCPDAKVTPFTSADIAAERVRTGNYDVFCTGTNTAVDLMTKQDHGLKLLQTLPVSVSECFAVNKAQPALYSIIDKTLSKINRGVSNAETYNIIGTLENAKQQDASYVWLILSGFLAIAVLIVGGVILFTMDNHRRLDVDGLTGGRNKRRFIKDSERAVKKLEADRLALAVIDIDKFKFVNDRLGYEEGNNILTRLFNTISDDAEKSEVFARVSDDNFALVMHNASDTELEARIGKIYSDFTRRNTTHTSFPISLSAGICRLGQCKGKFGAVDINAAIDRCNIARKTIKDHVKNKVAFYDGKIREKELRDKDYENEMPQALKNREFSCYLQPKYGTKSRHIEGAEALIRWTSKEFGFVYPSDFIPLSEKNGFVVELDFFILEEVCKLMRRWLDDGLKPVVISVNQSRLHLNAPDYIGKLREIVDKYNIPYEYIELELTESVFTDDADLMIRTMKKLHDVGFKLSIDDFGSGYSSLNMLKDMPADVVKIDREFFNTTADSEKGRAVISSVVDLANKLHMKVISEGVETEDQVEFLADIGCHMVQGYFFAKPMTIKDFQELWDKDREEQQTVDSKQ